MASFPDDIWEAARSLRNAVVWQSNASVEIIASALMAQREAAEKARRASLPDALPDARWKLVPVEPTDAMIDAGAERIVREYSESDWEEAKDMAESLNPAQVWSAMLSACPAAPTQEGA